MSLKIGSDNSTDELRVGANKALYATLKDDAGLTVVPASDSTLTSRLGTLGQKTMAGSAPVVIASDQSALPVSVASFPLPSGAATESTLSSVLTTAAFQARIPTLGQNAAAGSLSVILASDQGAVPVSGTFWQATQPVSGTVAATQSGTWNLTNISGTVSLPTGASTETTLASRLADSTFTGRINTQGQKTMAASTPVVLASDQAAIPVSQSGTWTNTVTQGTAANLRSQTASESATAAAVPSLASLVGGTDGTNLRALSVTSAGVLKIDGTATTQPISAASLPLPTGAATETTLGGVLTTTAFQARINTLGQKTAANSTPVVLASDQSSLTISGTVTANAGTGTFGTQDTSSLVDNAGFTDGASRVLPVGFIFDEAPGTALTENDVGAARVNANRALTITLEDGTTRGQRQVVNAAGAALVGTPATASLATLQAAQAATATLSNVAASASNVTLLSAQAARKGVIIYNDSATASLYMKFGATATTSSFTYKLSPGMGFEFPVPCYVGQVDGIWDAAVGTARITELT